MPKKISLDRNALQKLLAGVNILADTVGLTLGPRGRNVLLSRGILTPNFWKPQEEREITLQNPYILVTDKKISKIQDLVPILEDVINEPQPRPLLIIAEEVTGEALATLIMNRKQGVIEVLCIHPPEFGEGRTAMLEDIAILTGSVFLSDAFGHELPETTLDISDIGWRNAPAEQIRHFDLSGSQSYSIPVDLPQSLVLGRLVEKILIQIVQLTDRCRDFFHLTGGEISPPFLQTVQGEHQPGQTVRVKEWKSQ